MSVRSFKKNKITKEEVVTGMEQEYAFNQLGITIQPKGKNGEYTTEQQEFIDEFVYWYFDNGEWEDIEIYEDEPSTTEMINESCYKDDLWRKEKREE